jgi:rhodanese-related sulfurtransferase
MKGNASNLTLTILLSLIFGMIGAYFFTAYYPHSQAELIKGFYATETAVHISPHHIRKEISKGDTSFILVDLRSEEEYIREHVVGAINIPAYKDPNTSAYGDVERIVNSFKSLNQNKDIIVYCYSIPCMTGRKVGKILVDHGIYVQHLGVGWNEWRHFWTLWNHEHEWNQTNVKDFIASGREPGIYKGSLDVSPCTEGELGC